MAKHIRDSVIQHIVQVLDEHDGLTTEELSLQVSKKGDYSKAAFFRALSDLKAEGTVVGIREGRHTKNHLQSTKSRIPTGIKDPGSRTSVKSIINKRALALIDELLGEQDFSEDKPFVPIKEQVMPLYSLIETYEESKGIRYKRPWNDDANLDEVPLSDWIKFLGYVVGDVCTVSKQSQSSQAQEHVDNH